MTVAKGTRLGSYEILSPLGAGGMGEVWRATDTRLGREVALKVLPEAFASDPDKLARFEREAKVIASLNHPNIAHLYGLETVTSDADSDADAGACPKPQAPSHSSHPAVGTAAPQSGPTPPDGLEDHTSRMSGGTGGNSKLKTQNSKLSSDAAAGSSPEPQASSLSSHPAAGTAAPQSPVVGHASRVPGGGGGVE